MNITNEMVLKCFNHAVDAGKQKFPDLPYEQLVDYATHAVALHVASEVKALITRYNDVITKSINTPR